mmetsp:Transcript_48597/g.156965  ORF Transcript_48597/g.156965 Transcript_48597/m.156965 type:complete len:256 (+) Transcript_48597:256-1023(+)
MLVSNLRGKLSARRAEAAIPARTRLGIVLLMVALAVEERGCRDNLRGDLATARGLGRLELVLILVPCGLGELPLGLAVVVDARPVLGAPVASLLVLRGGVVFLPEHLQQVSIRDHLGVVHDADDLVVAGHAGAYVLVGGVVDIAARVAHLRGVDSFLRHVQVLGAPEAAHAEHGFLHPRRPRRVHRIAGEEMFGIRGRCLRDRRNAAWRPVAEDGTGHPVACLLHPRRHRRVHRIADEEMFGIRGRCLRDRRNAA